MITRLRLATLAATVAALAMASTGRAQTPPFGGTAYLSTSIITSADPSALIDVAYVGTGSRLVYDRRVNRFERITVHLFDAQFDDGLDAEIQVNPEFGAAAAAEIQATTYATAVGRLPTSLRADVDSITIHKGLQPFGGGNRNILIHTDQAISYGGYLEEVLFHEATHTSFDADHAFAPGWVAAQQLDANFISTYARDNPTREDVAESLLPWFALRHAGGLFPYQVDAIQAAMPNRLAYFDALDFQLYNPSIPGDFDGNRIVDAADLAAWKAEAPMASGATQDDGDADRDGDVDGADLLIWQRQITAPRQIAPASQLVPEPQCLGPLAATALAALLRGVRGSSRWRTSVAA
jgi:hypothetical protein